MKTAGKTKKTLAIFLSLLMLLGNIGLVSVLFRPTAAAATEFKASDVSSGDVTFVVPEAIYLYPNGTSWKDAVATPFQYYVNNDANGNPIAEASTVGKIYFSFPDISGNATISYEYGGSVTLSSGTVASGGSVNITGGTSSLLGPDTTGEYILWKAKFTDSKDNKEKTAYAYTYVYKPYVVPVGGFARVENLYLTHSFAQQLTWISGVHAINDSGSFHDDGGYYPNYTGEFGLAAFISKNNTAYIGDSAVTSSTTDRNQFTSRVSDSTRGYLLFANTGTGTVHHTASSDNKGVTGWGSTSQNGSTFNKKSFDYLSKQCDTNWANISTKNVTAALLSAATGSIVIDTSRYTNLKDIPNLGVGLQVTDDEECNGGYWYVADYTTQSGVFSPSRRGTYAYGDETDRNVLFQDHGTIIAQQTNNRNEYSVDNMEDGYEDEGVKYAGTWPRAIMNAGAASSTQRYSIKGTYGNGDWNSKKDSDTDYCFTHVTVDLNATQFNKAELRAAVNKAIREMARIGMTDNWNSCYFNSDDKQKLGDFVAAYQAAAKALTQVDLTSLNATALIRNLDASVRSLATSVRFDVNGGQVSNETVYLTVGVDSNGRLNRSVSYTLPEAVNPQYSGGGFAGWSTNKNAVPTEDDTNQVWDSGTRLTLGYNETIYAIWFNQVFQIHYDLKGGNLPAGKTNPTQYTKFYSFTLNNPVKTGYTFAGWTAQENAVPGAADQTITIKKGSTGERYFYAHWKENQYSIGFDRNIGSMASGDIGRRYYAYSQVFNLPDGTQYSSEKYAFQGWNTAADGSGTSYAPGEEVTMLAGGSIANEPITLYAQWLRVKYDVILDANGGTVADGATELYQSGDSITLPEANKDGFQFDKWVVSGVTEAADNGNGGWTIGGEYAAGAVSAAGLTGNVTFTATYTAPKFRITYVNDGETTTQEYTTESAETVAAPTKEGYKLTWLVSGNTDGNWTESSVLPGTPLAGRYGNVTLTAQWEEIPLELITVFGNGVDVQPLPEDGKVKYSKEYTFYVTVDPAKEVKAENITAVGATVTATPDPDDVNKLTVDLTEVYGTDAKQVILRIPSEDRYFAVTLTGADYTKNANVDADTKVKYGEDFDLTFDAADGYENFNVTCNGAALADQDEGTGYKYTVADVTEALAFEVTATLKNCSVTVVTNDGIQIEAPAADTVQYGNDVIMKVSRKEHYNAAHPTVTATVGTASIDLDSENTGWYIVLVEDVTADTVITINAIPDKYDITFNNYDGTELAVIPTDYGTAPVYTGETPVKESGEEGKEYTFVGWATSADATEPLPSLPEVVGEATYYAVFKYATKIVVVKFVNYNGDAVSRQDLEYGAAIVPPEDPTRPEDARNTYTFSGWEPEVPATATVSATYKATYEAHPIEFTNIYKNYDGTVLQTAVYTFYTGNNGRYTEKTPARATDETNHYNFKGWSEPTVDASDPTGRTKIYVAQFVEKPHEWDEGVYAAGFTCSEGGQKIYTCVYGEKRSEQVPPTGDHHFGEWIVVTPASTAKEGREKRVCEACGYEEYNVIPMKEKQISNSGPCPLCGKVHDKHILDWVVGVFHRFLYLVRSFVG